MKRLFYTKSKAFCSEEEVQLENIKPITEIPLELKGKEKNRINKNKEEQENGI